MFHDRKGGEVQYCIVRAKKGERADDDKVLEGEVEEVD